MARRVLLVHGAWHGAWCWERVLALLADAGVEASAVDLPGHGADPGPLGDLHTDVARVRAELDRLGDSDGDSDGVVLAGHSYGGAVITGAGEHRAVDHLVYIAAFALDDGESCLSAAITNAGGLSHEGRPNLAGGFVDGPGQTFTLEPPVAAACFYNDCDEATVAWALDRLGPQPQVTLAQSPEAVAWRSKASTYAVCTHDMAVHPCLQRILAARCGAVVDWPTSHSPFLSRPDLVAGLLTGLAGAPGPG
jgi:pimeloyl-ACP methyl ester carboxylesterase